MEIQTMVKLKCLKAHEGTKLGETKEFHPIDAREQMKTGNWQLIGNDKFHVGPAQDSEEVAEEEAAPASNDGGSKAGAAKNGGGSIAGAGNKA